ncbi:hypothetical protein VOF76_26370, partial [Leclercia adecarboxylata]
SGVDEEAFAAAKAQADAVNAINAAVTVERDAFAGLTSTEARIEIERKYKPLLTQLIHQHKEACDNVTRLEDGKDAYCARVRGRYASELKHPEIKRLEVAGVEHFNHLVRSGSLQIEGYHLVENRPVGMNGRSTLIFIPSSKNSLFAYAETEEAKSYADDDYQRELKRHISKRNAAARELTELQNTVSDLWNSVEDFSQMFGNIRKGRK